MSATLCLAERTEPAVASPDAWTIARVIELLLKDQRRIDQSLRGDAEQRSLIPKLLGISMASFAIYGIVATVMLNFARRAGFWAPYVPDAFWENGTFANLTLAYCLGLIAANGICLPSFYFYTLLAGVRITMVGVVAHGLRGMASGAVMLVGVLPIYVAFALSAVIFSSDRWLLMGYTMIALALPFLAGLWGGVCLNRGFMSLSDTLPEHDRACRTRMLGRLIFAWSGLYAFVTPLVIYSIWQHLSEAMRWLGGNM